MATQKQVSARTMASSTETGAIIITLAGAGLIGYGIMFLIRNFNGFIELGLSPEQIGVSPEQIRTFNLDLYHYISHLQVAIAGFLIALGIAVIALAWFGIRRGDQWALWTALFAPLVAIAIGLPLHYPYGFATFGHLGLIYLDAALLLVGTVVAYRAMRS